MNLHQNLHIVALFRVKNIQNKIMGGKQDYGIEIGLFWLKNFFFAI